MKEQKPLTESLFFRLLLYLIMFNGYLASFLLVWYLLKLNKVLGFSLDG